MDLGARTDALFAGFAAMDGDGVSALCAPDVRIKQNNGPDTDLPSLLAGLRAMLWDAGVKTAYSNVRRTVADHTVTEQHLVTLTGPDGAEVSSDVCVVLRFDSQGLVTRIDEYLDMTVLAPLFG